MVYSKFTKALTAPLKNIDVIKIEKVWKCKIWPMRGASVAGRKARKMLAVSEHIFRQFLEYKLPL